MDSEEILNDSEQVDDNDDEDDEEFTSPAQVLQKFQEVWINEKLAPDLLPFEGELLECLQDQIKHMEGNLANLQHGDLRLAVHQMELERIQYMVNNYLKIRLLKIENFGSYLLQQERQSRMESRMSPEEQKFATELTTITEAYLKDVAIQHMPPDMQGFSLAAAVTKPNLDSFVFLKVKKRTPGVLVEEETEENREELVDFDVDNQHFMRYRPIRELLSNGRIKLI